MSAPRYARFSGRVLARYAPPVSEDPPSAEARASAIRLIERTIARRARTRNIVRWVSAIAAAAAVGATFGVWRHRHDGDDPSARAELAQISPIVGYPLGAGASVWEDGARAALAAGGALAVGSRLETPANGRAALAFASGTSGVLGESAELTVNGDGATQVLRLEAGSVDLHVAKVSVDHRFMVTTPDAEVEVHGTQFRVSIGPSAAGCGDTGVTHVIVTEGVVVVRHGGVEKRVPAGEQWPPACVVAPETSAPVQASATAPPSGPSMASTLGEQNDLFADGVLAKHRGDTQAAIAAFDRFLVTYPASPLAQSASVERMRLLRSAPSTRSVAAARQYLARYPNGFATAEAEAIVAGAR
jgi:ferric-dicitrate binding protein FerR (iron transport regulator)